jgi:superfamily I DNA/RNA helicase
MGNYNIDVSQGTKVKFERIASAYVEYKRKNKLYDFTDLPLYLFDVLNEYNETITNIDGLFVDEYQDVDKVQAQIFTKVDAKKHFYIGDTDQAIYGFRGADSSVIDNLQGFTRIRLEENYRSYQSIVDFATTARDYTCISDIRELKPSWIKAVRKEASGEVFMINEDGECFDFVKKTKPEMDTVLTNFMQYKPYILCRSNKQVKYVQQCGYNNVSTIHQAKGLEYPYVIVTPFVIDSDEEKNVFYVACTRAQNGLLVCDYAVLLSFLQDNCDEIAPEIIF